MVTAVADAVAATANAATADAATADAATTADTAPALILGTTPLNSPLNSPTRASPLRQSRLSRLSFGGSVGSPFGRGVSLVEAAERLGLEVEAAAEDAAERVKARTAAAEEEQAVAEMKVLTADQEEAAAAHAETDRLDEQMRQRQMAAEVEAAAADAEATASAAAATAKAVATALRASRVRKFEFGEAKVGVKLHFAAQSSDVECLVTEGSEAARQGLLGGSLLFKVNGMPIAGLAPLQVQALIRARRPLLIEVNEPLEVAAAAIEAAARASAQWRIYGDSLPPIGEKGESQEISPEKLAGAAAGVPAASGHLNPAAAASHHRLLIDGDAPIGLTPEELALLIALREEQRLRQSGKTQLVVADDDL